MKSNTRKIIVALGVAFTLVVGTIIVMRVNEGDPPVSNVSIHLLSK